MKKTTVKIFIPKHIYFSEYNLLPSYLHGTTLHKDQNSTYSIYIVSASSINKSSNNNDSLQIVGKIRNNYVEAKDKIDRPETSSLCFVQFEKSDKYTNLLLDRCSMPAESEEAQKFQIVLYDMKDLKYLTKTHEICLSEEDDLSELVKGVNQLDKSRSSKKSLFNFNYLLKLHFLLSIAKCCPIIKHTAFARHFLDWIQCWSEKSFYR